MSFLFRRSPRPTTINSNLQRNVGIYVQSYLKNRNVPNKVPPINGYIARALHTYINAKRPRVAGNVSAAVGNAKGSNENAAKAAQAALSTPSSASPETAATNVQNSLSGASPVQQAAGAASAANQQALVLGQTPLAAQQKGAEAAAQAAQRAQPNATPEQQAQTAAAGAAAANLNAKRAKLASLLNGVTNDSITRPNGKSINEIQKLKTNLESLNINNNRKNTVLRLINNRLRTNVAHNSSGSGGVNLSSVRGAIGQNTNAMNKGRALSEIKRLNVLLKRVGQINNQNLKSQINNYRRRLNAKIKN